MRVYVEYGIGFSTPITTEWECPLCEVRMAGKHVPTASKRVSMYARMQVGVHVIIVDGDGVHTRVKAYPKLKLLLGFGYAAI